MLTKILIGIVLLVFLLWNKIFGTLHKNFPPGPRTRFPIAGNLPQLGKDPLATLSEWKKKYGNVVGLRFGEFNVVLLSGYDVIKEAFDKSEFAGRPKIGPFQFIAGPHKRGLVTSEGAHWSEIRRFALRNLRDFGFGKKSMEGMIHEDVIEFINTLKKTNEAPISTDRMLSLVVLSALWNIVAGERFEHGNPKFQKVLDGINGAIASASFSGPVIFMPSLAKWFPKLSGWDKFPPAIEKAKHLIGNAIFEHKSTFDVNNLRDFMDVYLKELTQATDENSPFYKKVGDEHMLVVTMNLFAAGAETTSNTLNWSLYLLTKHQEIQKKAQKELDDIVGRSRLPGLDDMNKMPYIEAVMLEVFRMSSIVPFGVFHNTMEDVTFHGYQIPKDTAIMANLFEVHHDKATWGDPDVFRPERFLSADGKKVIKVGHVIPFSVGKRLCIGETLARNEFFLILTGVLQRFHITFDPNDTSDAAKPLALFRTPPARKLIFKDRNK